MTLTLQELEKRVKVLEDIEEIKQMHIRYILDLNHQDFAGTIEYFTPKNTMVIETSACSRKVILGKLSAF